MRATYLSHYSKSSIAHAEYECAHMTRQCASERRRSVKKPQQQQQQQQQRTTSIIRCEFYVRFFSLLSASADCSTPVSIRNVHFGYNILFYFRALFVFKFHFITATIRISSFTYLLPFNVLFIRQLMSNIPFEIRVFCASQIL